MLDLGLEKALRGALGRDSQRPKPEGSDSCWAAHCKTLQLPCCPHQQRGEKWGAEANNPRPRNQQQQQRFLPSAPLQLPSPNICGWGSDDSATKTVSPTPIPHIVQQPNMGWLEKSTYFASPPAQALKMGNAAAMWLVGRRPLPVRNPWSLPLSGLSAAAPRGVRARPTASHTIVESARGSTLSNVGRGSGSQEGAELLERRQVRVQRTTVPTQL